MRSSVKVEVKATSIGTAAILPRNLQSTCDWPLSSICNPVTSCKGMNKSDCEYGPVIKKGMTDVDTIIIHYSIDAHVQIENVVVPGWYLRVQYFCEQQWDKTDVLHAEYCMNHRPRKSINDIIILVTEVFVWYDHRYNRLALELPSNTLILKLQWIPIQQVETCMRTPLTFLKTTDNLLSLKLADVHEMRLATCFNHTQSAKRFLGESIIFIQNVSEHNRFIQNSVWVLSDVKTFWIIKKSSWVSLLTTLGCWTEDFT